MGEQWREVAGFPDYEVNTAGLVRSWRPVGRYLWPRKAPILLRPGRAPGQYPIVVLTRDGKTKKTRAIHRLVLEAFAGPCPRGMEACHNNGDREDNRLSNLRWDTRKNNHADKHRHGTISRGSQVSHLVESEVLRIRSDPRTYRAIADDFGIGLATVHNIKKRKSWGWLHRDKRTRFILSRKGDKADDPK